MVKTSHVSARSREMDMHYKRSDYSKMRGLKVSPAWTHFWRRSDGLKAQCKLCLENEPPKLSLIPTVRGNTAGMFRHLENSHSIFLKKPPNSGKESTNSEEMEVLEAAESVQPSSSKSSAMVEKDITTYFPFSKEDTLESCVAELVATDGISFHVVSESRILRKLFRKAGYGELPRSHNTIRSHVMKYGAKVKTWTIETLKSDVKSGSRYSITLDEWTSKSNRRYLNVNLHSEKAAFINLGLAPVDVTFSAEQCVQLVKKRLTEFGIDLTQHVIACTNDGASVMAKYGRLSQVINQLCFAHAIQLAVVDVFYEKKSNPVERNEEQTTTSDESEAEEEATTGETGANQSEATEELSNDIESDDELSEAQEDFTANPNSGEVYEYRSEKLQILTEKIRRIVRMFRKSPKKYLILSRQVQCDRGDIENIRQKSLKSSLKLILDTKKRWSSLFDMLKRFQELQQSIEKAIIELRSRKSLSKKQKLSIQTLNEEEKDTLADIVTALGPVKVAVEEICHRDVNLLSFETIWSLLRKTMMSQECPEFGLKLRLALERRINERRTIWSKVLYTLHHGCSSAMSDSEDSSSDSVDSDDSLILSSKRLKFQVYNMLRRVLDLSEYPDSDEDIMDGSSRASKPAGDTPSENCLEGLSLREKMKMARMSLKKPKPKAESKHPSPSKSLKQLIAAEILEFEKSGRGATKGHHLQQAYNLLQTIRPTSVESERVFSLAGLFASKLRPRLSDSVLDMLTFLRSYFLSASS